MATVDSADLQSRHRLDGRETSLASSKAICRPPSYHPRCPYYVQQYTTLRWRDGCQLRPSPLVSWENMKHVTVYYSRHRSLAAPVDTLIAQLIGSIRWPCRFIAAAEPRECQRRAALSSTERSITKHPQPNILILPLILHSQPKFQSCIHQRPSIFCSLPASQDCGVFPPFNPSKHPDPRKKARALHRDVQRLKHRTTTSRRISGITIGGTMR